MNLKFIAKNKNKFIGVYLPDWLFEKTSKEAEQYGISVNKYITNLVYTVLIENNNTNTIDAAEVKNV